jgi:hypothetical protein
VAAKTPGGYRVNKALGSSPKGIRRSGPPQRKLGCVGSNADKFDKTHKAKLVADIARGVPIKIACAAIGISDHTFQNWLVSHPEFAQALATEKQRVIQELLGIVLAGKKDPDWRAAAWLLERGYPEAFALKPQQQPQIFAQQNNYQLSEEEARKIDARVKMLEEADSSSDRPPNEVGDSSFATQ